MKKTLSVGVLLLLFLFTSCQSREARNNQVGEELPADTAQKITWGEYTKIKAMDIQENFVRLIAKDWMLVTAGNESAFNTMTASWGAIGEIWAKPVAIITIRSTRYTHEFLQANDYYTLCFFDEEYRGQLELMGSKSGRDSDKIKESGLTPVVTPKGSMAYAEARMIIECKKLYSAPLLKENFTDEEIYQSVYTGHEKAPYTQYIGQIVNVWRR